MKHGIDDKLHHATVQRALAIGRDGDPSRLQELVELISLPSPEARRLAASAIGKLARHGADPPIAVAALAPVALKDAHPQAQQYALRALKEYGVAGKALLADLDDLGANETAKDYVRSSANAAALAIRDAMRRDDEAAIRRCTRCGKVVEFAEYRRSTNAFQRVFCDGCFDEVFMDRRNFETTVELNKTIVAKSGTLVQSDGERQIAEWLAAHGIAYRYDEKFRILSGHAVRPDFYLPELDVYIEYWGMDTAEYKIGMLKKQQLYQQQGKRVISIYPSDKPRLDALLSEKLGSLGFRIARAAAASGSERAAP